MLSGLDSCKESKIFIKKNTSELTGNILHYNQNIIDIWNIVGVYNRRKNFKKISTLHSLIPNI